jgi:cell wall-associated NlpC family hydrolase
MLSFIISNVLVVAHLAMGASPVTLDNSTVDQNQQAIADQAQNLIVTGNSVKATRDALTINFTPVPQVKISTAQTASGALTAQVNIPLSKQDSSIIQSAMKYVGMQWDCTMLVEQSLRDMGYTVPDLGPMQFGPYGTVFSDPNQVQPGDIMMRAGHVAIYIGNDLAIHGGYRGIVQVVPTSPSEFYEFVRI